VVNQFTAPMNQRVPPPHTTGGALDVFLVDDRGKAYDMHSPFKSTDHACFALDAAGLSEEARKHREILREALETTELTNYPSEYWHWTYGDQGWAYRGDHPAAFYGAIEPEGWTIAPEDDVEDPLVFFPLQQQPEA
jgi:D-alanyl-D-alanine dipeptidase